MGIVVLRPSLRVALQFMHDPDASFSEFQQYFPAKLDATTDKPVPGGKPDIAPFKEWSKSDSDKKDKVLKFLSEKFVPTHGQYSASCWWLSGTEWRCTI
jgi:hypothetical protein